MTALPVDKKSNRTVGSSEHSFWGSLRDNMRIIWAVASKDIVDALKNKNTLALILSVAFMILFYQFSTSIASANDLPQIMAYDAGHSQLVVDLDNSPYVDLREYDSAERMKQLMATGDGPELGLIIPAGFDQAAAHGESLVLEGYLLHWLSDEQRAEIVGAAEAEISELVGRPVAIQTAGNVIYPQGEVEGRSFFISLSLIYCLLMVGVSLVPHLMFEEKTAKTLDALMVSPATPGQIAAGKALAGAFYGMIAVAIVFLLNYNMILNWGLALVVAVVGVGFSVALGLLLGTFVDNRQQLMLVAWFLIVPLLIPVFLVIMTDLLPATFLSVLRWIPTVSLAKIVRYVFALDAAPTNYAWELAVVLGTTMALFLLVIWAIRRLDRRV